MEVLIRQCVFERDYQAYVTFLLQHHDQLHMPYPFPMKLSFISSPLLYGKAVLIFNQMKHELIGAVGFVYGTGANEYEDRYICQVEVAYLLKEFRGSPLFSRCLHSLVTLMKEGEPDVKLVQFWARPLQPEQKRLFSKLLALPGSTSQTMENGLTLYQVSFHELEAYCQRFC